MESEHEDVEVQKSLTFKLTTQEIADKGRKAAELERETGEQESQFENVKAEWKGKINKLENEKRDLLRTIRKGEEERQVQCIMRKEYSRMVVQYLWKGIVMEERAMTLDERQLSIVPSTSPQRIQEDLPLTEEDESVRSIMREQMNRRTAKDSSTN